jgi:nucleoside-diphosphate-sugar epimerase
MLRILVSGAAGFIGSHLSELLVADGHAAVGFLGGRLKTGQRKAAQNRPMG